MFHVKRLDRLVIYEPLLRQWQKAVNLVAPSTLGEHLASSFRRLRPAGRRWPQQRERWVDLGSGAGFPGLVVAILLARLRRADGAMQRRAAPFPRMCPRCAPHQGEGPARAVTLIESNARKCAFLREVVRQTGIAARCRCGYPVDKNRLRGNSS